MGSMNPVRPDIYRHLSCKDRLPAYTADVANAMRENRSLSTEWRPAEEISDNRHTDDQNGPLAQWPSVTKRRDG